MKNDRDLGVPAEVIRDPKANEVIRAWVANNGLVCALRPTTWEKSWAWGIVLADVARHVANALRDERGDEPSLTLKGIQEVFNREMADPTEEPTGSFV